MLPTVALPKKDHFVLDTPPCALYNKSMSRKSARGKLELVELRHQAHYWRAMHARTLKREAAWKEKAERLEQVVGEQGAQIRELIQQVEALKAKVIHLQQQVFGRKSEQRKTPLEESNPGEQQIADSPDTPAQTQAKRGKQPGTKGYGRKCHENLPVKEIPHHLPEEKQCCPKCRKPFAPFPGTEDSQEIDWEVRLVRHLHKRFRYQPTCNCGVVPGIVAAPPPAKLIPKGMFSVGFWVRLLLEKFLFQRPLYRVRQVLALEGLSVSQGTLTGGLQRLGGGSPAPA